MFGLRFLGGFQRSGYQVLGFPFVLKAVVPSKEQRETQRWKEYWKTKELRECEEEKEMRLAGVSRYCDCEGYHEPPSHPSEYFSGIPHQPDCRLFGVWCRRGQTLLKVSQPRAWMCKLKDCTCSTPYPEVPSEDNDRHNWGRNCRRLGVLLTLYTCFSLHQARQ